MNFLYCNQKHFWTGENTAAICPTCHRPGIGMVNISGYRRVFRTCIQPQIVMSVIKHGDWSGYSLPRMLWVLWGELFEVVIAVVRRDLHGPHGVVAEAAQVAVVCIKIVHNLSLRRRVMANDDFKPMCIGPYSITPAVTPGKVWIQSSSGAGIKSGLGEGGEFDMVQFKQALAGGEASGDVLGAVDRFFWENF